MNESPPRTLPFAAIVARHRAVLFDADGVLVDANGPIPGAADALRSLDASCVPWLVVSNDAARLPTTMAARFQSFGLPITPDHVVSAGVLLTSWFQARGLGGARCVVLGPEDSRRHVERAGGVVVAPDMDAPADVVLICDESGFDFLPTVDATLSMLLRAAENGAVPVMALANPDLVYPKAGGRFGITAGSIAVALEAALRARFPERDDLRFERLGKPERALFDEACARLRTRDVVMIGDQLATDILGAQRAEVASALVLTGIGRLEEALRGPVRPTYVVGDWGRAH